MTSNANITGAAAGEVVTIHAVITRADGTVEDLGVIATSDPERTPLTPRKDTADGPNPG